MFGNNHSTRALQVQTYIKENSMMRDRFVDIPRLSIELNPFRSQSEFYLYDSKTLYIFCM